MTIKHMMMKDALGRRIITFVTCDTTQQTIKDLQSAYDFPWRI
ncbi:MAG: hypothetical protein ACYDAJ_02685 [Nitrosotalea sp.]